MQSLEEEVGEERGTNRTLRGEVAQLHEKAALLQVRSLFRPAMEKVGMCRGEREMEGRAMRSARPPPSSELDSTPHLFLVYVLLTLYWSRSFFVLYAKRHISLRAIVMCLVCRRRVAVACRRCGSCVASSTPRPPL